MSTYAGRGRLPQTLFWSAVAALACAPLMFGPAASAQTGPALTWTAPVLVEHAPFAIGHTVSEVSCPSVALCVVGDSVGNILTSTDPTSSSDTWKTAAIAPGSSIGFLTCATTRFCVALATVRGRQRIFTSVNPTGGPRAWAARTAPMFLRRVSCPGTRLCVGVGKGAIATSTDPAAGRHSVWKVTSFGPQLSSTNITGVSCPRRTLCVAADDNGNVYASTNPTGGKSAWTITLVTTSGISPVTCPSASFCAALGGIGLIYSTNPAGGASAWHQVSAPRGFPRNLTCPSATFCAVVVQPDAHNGDGDLFITTDPTGGATAWQRVDIAQSGPMTALTCQSANLCVAGDFRGDVVSSTNPGGGLPAWTTVNITGFSAIGSLDCPFAALCLASDPAGNILTSTRPRGGVSAWHQAHVVLGPPDELGMPDQINAFSCPTTSLCVGVDDQGNVYWSTNPTGGASAWSVANIDPHTKIGSVACPTTSLCVAGDVFGSILTSTNPTGGASAWHLASIGSNSDGSSAHVTCPTASLCLATGDATILSSTDPAGGASTWHASVFFGGHFGFAAIACPTTTLCVAIAPGVIFSSRHPTGGILDWNKVSLPSGFSPGILSCPSAKFCVAGPFASFDPASGKPSAWLKSGVSAATLSCPTASLCVAGTDRGKVRIGTPRTPTATAPKPH